MKTEKTEFVLVETISMFRMRYVVEVPVGKAEYALDDVTMESAAEFSQKHLGETIVSHRVVTKEEIIALCDVDNPYCASRSDENKMENFTTPIKK